MVRRQCICGAHLYGLGHTGPNMFGFIPSSSLAHYNYDCEFNTGVTLPGGRILEQCENCGAIVLCEYPTLDGSTRGEDPLIAYGPGTVYEQCDIESVPLTYRSFRALMSSGVTDGVMYSEAFKTNIAKLFDTDIDHLPSWKVLKDALLDSENCALDEWWQAAIGRNFIVLYENSKALRLVAAWHRVPGTEILNTDMRRVIEENRDPMRHTASDTDEMKQAGRELEISDATKRLLLTGTHARLRLIARSMRLGKPITELARFVSLESLMGGKQLWENGDVRELHFVPFGIFHAEVADDTEMHTVDIIMRHNLLSRMMCSCEQAQSLHVCRHEVATILQLDQQFRFAIDLDVEHGVSMREGEHGTGGQFGHYANMLDVMREHEDSRDTYEWLTAYIQPLESDTGDLYHTEFMTMPGVMSSVPYVVYEPIMLGFIDSVLTRCSADFTKTLRRYGLDADVDPKILNMRSLDMELVSALITMIVYRERRSDGYLAECLENGVLVGLLKRMRELVEEHKGRQSRRIRQ